MTGNDTYGHFIFKLTYLFIINNFFYIIIYLLLINKIIYLLLSNIVIDLIGVIYVILFFLFNLI